MEIRIGGYILEDAITPTIDERTVAPLWPVCLKVIAARVFQVLWARSEL
jgi:hypothetical protein